MKWGIVGYGRFAPKFLTSLSELPSEEIFAIATKSGQERAREDYPKAVLYSDYSELFKDQNIDLVYIATTHNFHKQLVLSALEHGKHVICEKPMGMSTLEVKEMVASAKEKNLFLMEGLWSRYLPAYRSMIEEIENGVIGKPLVMTSNFCFAQTMGPEKRLLNKNLAGGALYDLGVYPISFALDVFGGKPSKLESFAEMTKTGVDGTVNMMLEFENGGVAQLTCSILFNSDLKTIIYGTAGRVEIDLFWKMESYTVIKDDTSRVEHQPFVSTGYFHEIKHALDCIEKGKIEPRWFAHVDSMLNAEVVDEIRSSF